MTHPDRRPTRELADGQVLTVAGTELTVLHTPGHAPGAVCLYAPDLGTVFTGDTLFPGGPGATGRSFSDFPTIIDSIRDRLLDPAAGRPSVHTGHGDATTDRGRGPAPGGVDRPRPLTARFASALHSDRVSQVRRGAWTQPARRGRPRGAW